MKATEHDKVRTQIESVSEPTLTDINFKMKSGELMVVIGQVGCGKTSLLYAIMQELEVCKGNSKVEGAISYVE